MVVSIADVCTSVCKRVRVVMSIADVCTSVCKRVRVVVSIADVCTSVCKRVRVVVSIADVCTRARADAETKVRRKQKEARGYTSETNGAACVR